MAVQKFNPLVKQGFQQLGSGFEPFVDEYSLFPVQIQQSFQQPITQLMAIDATIQGESNSNYAFPFMVQQNVSIKGYNFYIGTALTSPNEFSFAVYKYDTRLTDDVSFNKVYQSGNRPTVIQLGNGGGFDYTLDTPFLLQAGKIYICCIIPVENSTFNVQAIKHDGSTTDQPIPCNKILGANPVATVYNGNRIGVVFSGSFGDNGAPDVLNTSVVYSEEPYYIEYLRLTLQNA